MSNRAPLPSCYPQRQDLFLKVYKNRFVDWSWLNGNPETEPARRQICKAANSSPNAQSCIRESISARILMIYTIYRSQQFRPKTSTFLDILSGCCLVHLKFDKCNSYKSTTYATVQKYECPILSDSSVFSLSFNRLSNT